MGERLAYFLCCFPLLLLLLSISQFSFTSSLAHPLYSIKVYSYDWNGSAFVPKYVRGSHFMTVPSYTILIENITCRHSSEDKYNVTLLFRVVNVSQISRGLIGKTFRRSFIVNPGSNTFILDGDVDIFMFYWVSNPSRYSYHLDRRVSILASKDMYVSFKSVMVNGKPENFTVLPPIYKVSGYKVPVAICSSFSLTNFSCLKYSMQNESSVSGLIKGHYPFSSVSAYYNRDPFGIFDTPVLIMPFGMIPSYYNAVYRLGAVPSTSKKLPWNSSSDRIFYEMGGGLIAIIVLVIFLWRRQK